MSTLGLELRKLRRKRLWLMAGAGGLLQIMWLAGALAKRAGAATPEARLAGLALNEALGLAALVTPVLAALLASRLVTVDTEEGMGQVLTALGQRATTRWWAKLVIGSTAAGLTELILVGVVAVAAPGVGLRVTEGFSASLGPATAVILCASVCAMAVQLALCTCIERQAIPLGLATLATLVASALPYLHLEAVSWLLPWGLIGAASPISPVDSQSSVAAGGDLTLVPHPWALVLFAVVVTTAWVGLSRHLVQRQENHR